MYRWLTKALTLWHAQPIKPHYLASPFATTECPATIRLARPFVEGWVAWEGRVARFGAFPPAVWVFSQSVSIWVTYSAAGMLTALGQRQRECHRCGRYTIRHRSYQDGIGTYTLAANTPGLVTAELSSWSSHPRLDRYSQGRRSRRLSTWRLRWHRRHHKYIHVSRRTTSGPVLSGSWNVGTSRQRPAGRDA